MKILIVDDDALIRDGLKMILQHEEDMDIIGTASNGQEALKSCEESIPDVVVMDIRMPILDGVEATKRIKEQYRNVKVLLLTTFKDVEYIKSALKYGADGYVLKSNSSESIIESIRAVYQGNVVFEKEIAARITELMDQEEKINWKELNITPREYELMELVSKGMCNKEISGKLHMSEGTIRNNISTLLDKLELRDRTQLAIFFIRKIEKSKY